jgi:hypothetical protein
MTLQEMQERVLAWATGPGSGLDLSALRRAYFESVGEPNEEDRSFEQRANAFLDWLVHDHRVEGDSVLERFMRANVAALTTDELTLFRALGKNIHSLFEVRRIRPDQVRVRDVFTTEDHDVTERRTPAGLSKGDLIEARLLPYQNMLIFSGAFLYHPPAARKTILGEVKRMRKAVPKGTTPEVPPFLGRLAKMALKLERYRNVKVESIYDFG